MKTRIIENDMSEHLQEEFLDVCYAGERLVIRNKEGAAVALVPMEDLEVLEEIEKAVQFT